MGSVKRDIYRNGREHDVTYTYTDDGIAVLLKDIYRLNEKRLYKGDIDATAIITDLKLALDSDCLTPRMRQIVALYYFVGLTKDEITEVLGITRPTVIESANQALERIANEMMDGNIRKRGNSNIEFSEGTPLNKWLADVGYGRTSIYEVPDFVFNDILETSKHRDYKAKEVLRQRIEGAPIIINYSEEEEYPALTEDQFKWRDRRMAFKPEIYPSGDVAGTRKVSIKLRDGDESGNEWVLEKRKLFVRGGN